MSTSPVTPARSWSLRPLVGIAVLASLALASGSASACDEAERLRLSDELKSLAQKNAWTGVERKYTELKRTKCELKYEQHAIGAESARNLGKTFEIWERLQAANAIDAQAEVTASIAAIEESYGKVEIRGDARHRAPLLRDEMPFAPDQRKSIEYAMEFIGGTGSFKGMLPLGSYRIADKDFTVEAGGDWQVISVGRGKPVVGPDDGGGVQSEKFINWAGPIAMVGTGFFGSGAPSNPTYVKNPTIDQVVLDSPVVNSDCNGQPDRKVQVTDANGDLVDGCVYTKRQPGDIGLFQTPVVDITLGGEAGLTYRAPEAGVVGTVTYRRLFGNSFNQITLHGAGMIRPGDFRIVAGPTFGMVVGKGTGYADWVDEGQSEAFRNTRQDQETVSGIGMGGGLAGSFGYAALDLEPFSGLVELHGHFQHDGRRAYSGIGLRIGIVPKVTRFEG